MTEERTEDTQLDNAETVDVASEVISEIEAEEKATPETKGVEEVEVKSEATDNVKEEPAVKVEPEELRVLRTQYEEIQKQHEELKREAIKAFKDPEYYKEQRRLAGLEQAETQNIKEHSDGLDLSNVTTAEDLSRTISSYVNEKIAEGLRKADATVNTRVTEATEPFVREKWDKARADLREKYGEHFSKVEANILQKIQTDYRSHLQTSKSEKELMEKVLRAEYPEEFIAYEEKQRKNKREKVQQASTEKPVKKTPTSKRLGLGDPIAEEVISEMMAEYGEA